MEIIITLLTSNQIYVEGPDTLVEILGFILLGGVVAWRTIWSQEKEPRWTQNEWMILGVLAVMTCVCTLFGGIRLPAEGALPRPLLPDESAGPALMVFSAIPWMLAAGILGPGAAAGIACLSGLILGLFETHSLFSIIQLVSLAAIFSMAIRQPYRTKIFHLLRHPLVAALVVGAVFYPLFMIITLIETDGALVSRVDYSLTSINMAAIANWGEVFAAGIVAEIAAAALPRLWKKPENLIPSPTETSIQMRFFFATGSVVAVLLLTLMIADWLVAGQAARNLLEESLASTAEMAAENIPYFLETGQNLILQTAADTALQTAAAQQVPNILAQHIRAVPYFRSLYYFDDKGAPVSGYPETDVARLQITSEENAGITLALQGVNIQTYTVPPQRGDTTAQVSFLAAVTDASGKPRGVVLGRTDLASNPFIQPIIQTFGSMNDSEDDANYSGIYGQIIDADGNILYHPITSKIMTTYQGQTSDTAAFFDETGSEGTRNLVYYQPTAGKTWAVILTAPAQRTQQLALTIALPMMSMILVIALAVIAALRISLRMVTASLQSLAGESVRISQGQLDHSLAVQGVDEVGKLGHAFEQMRVSLKARLDELNRLLNVSQGVASSLDMRDAVRPILEAALSGGACSARVVLESDPNIGTQSATPTRYGFGVSTTVFASLDNQILGLTRGRPIVILNNLNRGRGLTISVHGPRPGSLMAVALHHENRYYGTLWVAYDKPRTFSDEEIRFLSTLAGEAALAAANARLYASAEIGRERLEAILAATPDPVLVTDQEGNLLLANPAVYQMPGFSGKMSLGQPIASLIQQPDLLALLRSDAEQQPSREITFPNGKVYYATVSSVVAEQKSMGKVCIIRDITHYKELDALKSEFVSTVSHDLRSPLTLMRGYATMLQMVGDLNDQQKGYVRKIFSGVESMSRLVNNLLDLGRIEAGVGLQLEMIPAVEIVERVVNSLSLQAAQKNIQLTQELPKDGSPLIKADSALLQQALYNLVENAIKFTPVGGQVNVRAQTRDDGILFAVHDSGIGIAPLDQPRLFEKFYRGGQRETATQRGSGIGLAIVKSITERHGGKVWVESYLGKGSTFYVEIPFEFSNENETRAAIH